MYQFRGGLVEFPMSDGGFTNADLLCHCFLGELEVKASFSEMIADGLEFFGILR